MCVYVYMYIYIYIYAYAYMYIYTYTSIYKCTVAEWLTVNTHIHPCILTYVPLLHIHVYIT